MSKRHVIDKAGDFGRVAVLMGGISPEREISLMTGKAVLAALHRRGVDARGMDAADDLARTLLREPCDRVWNALHGPGGDGLVKVVEDRSTGHLVGATSVGPTGGEVLSMLATALHARVPTDVLREQVLAFPTFHRAVSAVLADLRD